MLDLLAPMEAYYRRTGQGLNPPDEWHWIGIGHQVAADATADTTFFAKFLEQTKAGLARAED